MSDTIVAPKDLREGDRIRVTLCGEVMRIDSHRNMNIRFDGVDYGTNFEHEELDNALIMRLEPPLKVGDKVKTGTFAATVRGIHDGFAWVTWDSGDGSSIAPLSSLTRVSETAE